MSSREYGRSVKCPVGEMSGRGNVWSGKYQLGKCQSWNCPSGKCSVGKCPRTGIVVYIKNNFVKKCN